ncbi:YIP1 family protein [Candidatus Poribacteria bacterium]|nr:YIP1 family protein [Candidatus Poribacteria bacterium]
METAEIISEIIIDPEKGFNEVLINKKSFIFSFTIVIIGLYCQVVAVLLQDGVSLFGAGILTISYVARLFFFVIFWILFAAIFHFIASIQKFEGNIINLFILLGVSLLPLIFLPAVSIISIYLGNSGYYLYHIMNFAILFWSLSLQIKSLKTIYNFKTSKAISVYITPFISIIVISIISIILLITFLISLFV